MTITTVPPVTTRTGAAAHGAGNHPRQLDAIVTHIESQLERFDGYQPVDVELLYPAGLNQREKLDFETQVLRLYEAAGWTVSPLDVSGVKTLRFD